MNQDRVKRGDGPLVSLVVTSYNQERTLSFLFSSLERQTFQKFEVIIADDGSSDATSCLCAEEKKFPVVFVTQSDEGYRKSKILNEAVRRAQSDYLIFIDGDVILEKHFIQDHLQARRENHFVCGRRVDLGPRVSQEITLDEIRFGKFDRQSFSVFWSALRGESHGFKRGFRVTHPLLRKWLSYDSPLDLLGSNFSLWKKDLLEVNGFNESLESYWGEDGDLYIRLRNSGKVSIGAKSICIQYHVFHSRREPTEENQKRYQRLLENQDYKWADEGYRSRTIV